MGSKPKRKPWWPWVVGILTPAVLIPVTASAWKQLGAVWAAPARVDAAEQKVKGIEEYIAEDRKTQEMMEKAPPGWRWDARIHDFVEDADDPRVPKRRK